MISTMEERVAVQEVQGSNLWHIHLDVMRGESIWLGTAVACCDIEDFPEICALWADCRRCPVCGD